MFQVLPATDAYLKHAYREIKGFEKEGEYRPCARMALKEIIEGRLEEEIGEYLELDPYERSQIRLDYRNGSYIRHLLTELGDLEIKVPRLRKRCFKFTILESYSRRTREVDKLILNCFVYGHSTRKVSEALLPLLGEKVSSSTVSRVSRCLDRAVEAFHKRGILDGYRFLYFDGVVLKSRYGGKVHKKSILCAYGITRYGIAEMIDFLPSRGETQEAWEGFLNDLLERGLECENTELIITDGGKGLHSALEVVLPRQKRQRCWAHKARNVLDKAKMKDHDAMKKGLSRIWNAKDLQTATKAYWEFVKRYRQKYPKAVKCLEKDCEELLAFYQVKQRDVWSKIRTTNPIERAFREVKRRTRPMGVFANLQSIERIIYAIFESLNRNWKLRPFKTFTQH